MQTEAWAWGGPVCPVRFKSAPEDFQVTEVLGYEPSGTGEHVYLWVELECQNTAYAARALARHLEVSVQQVAYSGLKDRQALTWQWFSIHLPGTHTPECVGEIAPGIRVLRQIRHERKLRRGAHTANAFKITLREPDRQQWPNLEARLALLATAGVPNYFGAQRFGHDAGNWQWSLDQVARSRRLGRQERDRVFSTLRAGLFNAWLSLRVCAGNWSRYLPGDFLLLNGTRSLFQPTLWDDELEHRLMDGDIHIGGVLPGTGQWPVSACAEALVMLAFKEHDALLSYLRSQRVEWMPRAARVIPAGLAHSWQDDSLVLSFELPAGAYATSVLRELVSVSETPLSAPANISV